MEIPHLVMDALALALSKLDTPAQEAPPPPLILVRPYVVTGLSQQESSVMMAIPKTTMVATLSVRERFSGFALEDLPPLQTNASSQ